MDEQEQRHFLTVDELADFLRVSRTTAYDLVTRGAVPRVRVGGQWRIPRTELEQHIAESMSKPAA
jgi:excisionase family DNA binding protein